MVVPDRLSRLAPICLGAAVAGLSAGCWGEEPASPAPLTVDSAGTSPPGGSPSAPVRATEAPLTAMSLEEFDAWWQTDIDVRDRPLGEVLEELVARVPDWNVTLKVADGTNGALERPISLSLSDVSVLEAIERACAAADLHPRYANSFSSGAEIVELHPGPRVPEGVPADAAGTSGWAGFAGPAAVLIDEVEQYPPHATGRVTLRLRHLKLPPRIAELSHAARFEVTAATAGGRDLLGEGGGSSLILSNGVGTEPGPAHRLMYAELRGLLRDVRAVNELRGRVEVKVPTAVTTVWFDEVKSNRAQDEGGVTVVLDRVTTRPDGETRIQYSVRGADALYGMEAYAFDAAGALLEKPRTGFTTGSYSYSEQNGTGDGSISFEGEPARLAVVLVTGRETFERDVVFRALPLSKSDRQPEALADLAFPGHDAPLTVESLGVTENHGFHKVRLRAANRSNKDVHEAEIVMSYLDAEGEPLKDQRATLRSGGFDFSPRATFLKAGAETEAEEAAHFYPDDAASVNVRVNSVRFLDGTSWEPDAAPPE